MRLTTTSHQTAPRRGDHSFTALKSLVVRYWQRFALASLLRAGAAALPALHPYFVAELATSADDPARIATFLLLIFGTSAAHSVLWSSDDYYISAKIQPVLYEFKKRAFEAVWSENYQQFVDRPSGKVASYVNDLRDDVQMLWMAAHFGFLPTLASLPVYVVLLWRTSAGNAMVYLFFPLLAIVVMTWAARPVGRRQRRLTDATSNNTGRVFDSYANFANVFSFRAQRKEIQRHNEQLDEVTSDDVSFHYSISTYWLVASVLVRGLLWASVLGYGWYRFDRGEIDLTGLVVMVTVLLDFTYQYWNLMFNVKEWIDRSARYREAYNYLFPGRDIIAEGGKDFGALDLTTTSDTDRTMESGLAVRGLSFSYPDEPERLILDDVTFTLRRGERLGIVGRSGEGKSTLIKILLGFYEPTAGEILLDGIPTKADELSELQAYVPQDTSLFQETIEYNIGYAEKGAVDPARIREAAERANIAAFIDSLPDGYQTMVGERGIKLSLGQRQRIAIARAFLKQSQIVILDEATSALDSETEARIQESLDELWRDRTAIIVAHRLATLNDVDRIIVIEQGRIVEDGTKAELLSKPGRFADMWGLQRAGML